MAITPNNYPFSGGAFMGGDSSYVTRGDIHTLNVTKNGESIGNYNPIVGDANIDIPSDVSNDTSTFTKASGDTSAMTSGSKLSVLFTAISGFFASMLSALGGKANKVQGATSGNLAALDANGDLTDSGKKPADFKTKQTAVPDPTPDGFGLSFIDSVSQDANGEITPHKKTVPDGTTAQKGVVQLQDSIGSTETTTDKAVTPHAVRDAIKSAVSSAYHASGTKTVAQLTSSLLIAENEGCVYNMTDSGTTTSDFVDGAGHPINAGDNVGVCDVGGGVYKFDLLSGFVDLSNYLTSTGDASNTTSTFTKNTSDNSGMVSGSKLSAIFTAISSFFASLKDLAFKDKVGTSDIADDAITADKVKDNETLPVNVSGSAASASSVAWSNVSGKPTKLSDFTDDITQQTYIASGTGSNKPASGAAVAQAVDVIPKLAGTRLGNGSQADLNDCISGSESDRVHSYYWVHSQKDNVSHKPTDDSGQCLSMSYNDNNAIQIVITGSGVTYSRSKVAGTWTDWFNIRDASWINSGTFQAAQIPTSLPNAIVKAAKNVNRIPIGSSAIDLNNLNASDDSKISVYEWWQSNKDNVSNKPEDSAGTLIVFGYDAYNCCQICEIAGINNLFYRVRDASGWYAWTHLVVASKDGVGFPSTPVYVDTDGSVKPCNFTINFGTPIAGTNVLNIVT